MYDDYRVGINGKKGKGTFTYNFAPRKKGMGGGASVWKV